MNVDEIAPIVVFTTTLMGRQSGQSVCVGIQLQITFSKIEFYKIFESQHLNTSTTVLACIHQV